MCVDEAATDEHISCERTDTRHIACAHHVHARHTQSPSALRPKHALRLLHDAARRGDSLRLAGTLAVKLAHSKAQAAEAAAAIHRAASTQTETHTQAEAQASKPQRIDGKQQSRLSDCGFETGGL